jgi:hypothetical protein
MRIRSRVVQRAECTLRRKIGGVASQARWNVTRRNKSGITERDAGGIPSDIAILNTVVGERVALVKGMAIRARAASLKNVYVLRL